MAARRRAAATAPSSRPRSVQKPVAGSRRKGNPPPAPVEVLQLPSPHSETPRGKKRWADSDTPPLGKKRRRTPIAKAVGKEAEGKATAEVIDDSAAFLDQPVTWADYFGSWPPMESLSSNRSRRRGSGKRLHSLARTGSYTQQVRDGESPPAWTAYHEEKMRDAGLNMNEHQTEVSVLRTCETLCDNLLKADSEVPSGSSFSRERLMKILEMVRYRNEARIVRDVTPLIVPSPELLYFDRHDGLEHICEAMNAEWTQCATLYGPQPKPDLVIGVAATAFTVEEKEKLRLSHTSTCPNLFPENMYYPFLICEVKGSNRPIEEAERQCMHSASIAVQAIVQLYINIAAIEEVNRQVLAFSVAHNKGEVKIFAHFAVVTGATKRFYRRPLYIANFAMDVAAGQWQKAYHVARGIYEDFFPQHLARIKSALSRIRVLAVESFPSELVLDNDSPDSAYSLPTSQEDGPSKRPALQVTRRLEQENEQLRKQVAELCQQQRADQKQQAALVERQIASMDKQMAQQREESQKQVDLMIVQMTQQKASMEKQMAQQQQIIDLLKPS